MNLNSVLIGSDDPKQLSDFYTKIFGKPTMEEQGYAGWQVGSGWITVGPHDQVKGTNSEPGRLILNIETTEVTSEFERIKGLGATVIKEPYNPEEGSEYLIATFADPDNNYFQLVSPM